MTPLQINVSPADWNAVLPITLTSAGALLVLVADLFVPRASRRLVAVALGLFTLVVTGMIVAQAYGQPAFAAFGGAFIQSGFGIVFQEIVVIAAFLSLLLAGNMGREESAGGMVALLLLSAAGALIMAGAANLMMIFLGLELLSLALYCLCGLAPRASARESALKYLILSSTASGFLLYGMALLFGATGSVALGAIAAAPVSGLLSVGAGLFIIGLAFKLSLVPFHVWTPDVYEGAPLPITAFMSVVTKAGALAVLARFAYAALPSQSEGALLAPLWILAAASMIVGNVAALAQTDIKRLLAYSGIAQLGYVVAAFAGTPVLGLRYAVFYLAAYMFMNLGAFAVVALLSADAEEGSRLASFAGLGYRRPVLAASMAFFLLSLAGLPPTAGFTGKLLILSSSVGAGYTWLAALLITGTAISIYAYFKIVRAMYTRVDVRHVPQFRPAHVALPWIAVGICAALVLVLGFYPLTPSNILPTVGPANVAVSQR